jgi:hypothetical protein
VFENSVLRNISAREREEIREEWRRLYNKELYALYSSPNIFRVIRLRMRWNGACGTHGGDERILVGRP